MAERRMFAKSIVDSDAFLELPAKSQLLYFHLAMRADDEGFVNKAKTVSRTCGCNEEDLQRLHDVVLRNPELLMRIQSFVDDLGERLVTHLAQRPGTDRDEAWMALTLAGGVVGRSIRDCIDDPTLGPLRSRVEHNLTLARELLTAQR